MLLNLIYIGSSTAFSAIISLTTLTLYVSYIIPVIVMVIRRFQKRKLQFGPFQLGRFGLPINAIGICWGIFTVAFVILPKEMPATAGNMNYAPVVFGAALIFSLILWFVYGKRVYHGPINELGEEDVVLI